MDFGLSFRSLFIRLPLAMTQSQRAGAVEIAGHLKCVRSAALFWLGKQPPAAPSRIRDLIAHLLCTVKGVRQITFRIGCGATTPLHILVLHSFIGYKHHHCIGDAIETR